MIDSAIMFLGGLYATLLAFRVVGVKAGDPKWEAWHRSWGRLLKGLGPALMIIAVLLLLIRNR
jgi:hypothetical protein